MVTNEFAHTILDYWWKLKFHLHSLKGGRIKRQITKFEPYLLQTCVLSEVKILGLTILVIKNFNNIISHKAATKQMPLPDAEFVNKVAEVFREKNIARNTENVPSSNINVCTRLY